MKKFLIVPAILLSLPSYALCPIGDGETVCTLPEFRQQVRPIYQESPSLNSTPNINLQPLSRTDPMKQMRGPNNDLNYNSGCQFGVCLRDPKESTLPINK